MTTLDDHLKSSRPDSAKAGHDPFAALDAENRRWLVVLLLVIGCATPPAPPSPTPAAPVLTDYELLVAAQDRPESRDQRPKTVDHGLQGLKSSAPGLRSFLSWPGAGATMDILYRKLSLRDPCWEFLACFTDDPIWWPCCRPSTELNQFTDAVGADQPAAFYILERRGAGDFAAPPLTLQVTR